MKFIKESFRFFTFYLVIICFSNCGNAKGNKSMSLDSNPPFSISKVYFQNWVAGVKEGGSGTNVYISLESIEEGVKIEQIYFRNKAEGVMQIEENDLSFIAYFRDDSGRDIYMDDNSIKEAQNTPPVHFDLASNEIVIRYRQKGKEAYFKISDIEEKPIVAYPEVNQKGID